MTECAGEWKLFGICTAKAPPGDTPLIMPRNNVACPATQWKAALEKIRSTGGSGFHVSISPSTHCQPGCLALAWDSISGELSTPVMAALGQRWRNCSVLLPGPQPRSTMRAGASRWICAMRSAAGRVRSLAYFKYRLGSQTGICQKTLIASSGKNQDVIQKQHSPFLTEWLQASRCLQQI